MYFAILDQNNICYIVQKADSRTINNAIELTSYDTSLIGQKWENGKWVPQDLPPYEEPVSPFEIIQENQLTIMEAMATQYEENLENQIIQMDVLATIYETQLESMEGVE